MGWFHPCGRRRIDDSQNDERQLGQWRVPSKEKAPAHRGARSLRDFGAMLVRFQG
jgi:hypothetical protein